VNFDNRNLFIDFCHDDLRVDPGAMILKIAGIVFSITSDISLRSLPDESIDKSFFSSDSPDAHIYFHFKKLEKFEPHPDSLLFSRKDVCKVYSEYSDLVMISGEQGNPQLTARIAKDFSYVDVFIQSSRDICFHDQSVSHLLGYPPVRFILSCLLIQRDGLLIHGCGIIKDSKGYLFAGKSGDGKSTMASLWKKDSDILNDEFVALVFHKGQYRIFGTPWTGNESGGLYGGDELEHLFFLHHASTNRAEKVTGTMAASMLLARSFAPIWYKKGIDLTLNVVEHLVRHVPCYDLGFLPDKSVIDYVQDFK
jgi:hypothetical protein